MSVFTRGIPVAIVERFWTIDPLTEQATLADPTTVTFEVEAPDGTVTSYEWGTDAEVANPSTGVYVLTLPPPLPTGSYRSVCVGTGAVEATSPATVFDVLEDGVLDEAPGALPSPGPCTPWISGEEVADFGCSIDTGSTGPALLDPWAFMASWLMFELSGRQFHGVCVRRVRPCPRTCRCWRGSAAGAWTWSLGYWNDGLGRRRGCPAEAEVTLAGYPVREILEVKVDGAAVAASEYRLVQRRKLLRKSDPGPPARPRTWPTCQDVGLDDDQPGTFSIRYRWGIDPPELGRQAAAQLACELAKAALGGKDCRLPSRATKVVRQGVTVERVTAIAEMLRQGSSGLPLVDAFLAGCNPGRVRRRPAVWSPDGPGFPQEG